MLTNTLYHPHYPTISHLGSKHPTKTTSTSGFHLHLTQYTSSQLIRIIHDGTTGNYSSLNSLCRLWLSRCSMLRVNGQWQRLDPRWYHGRSFRAEHHLRTSGCLKDKNSCPKADLRRRKGNIWLPYDDCWGTHALPFPPHPFASSIYIRSHSLLCYSLKNGLKNSKTPGVTCTASITRRLSSPLLPRSLRITRRPKKQTQRS